jgi:hypothetical protein
MRQTGQRHLESQDLELIAQKMESLRNLDAPGAFGLPGYENLIYLLAGKYGLREVRSEMDRYRICTEGSTAAGGMGSITAGSLMENIGRKKDALIHTSPQEYLFVSTISVPLPPEIRKRNLDGWEMEFSEKLPPGIDRNFGSDHVLEKMEPLVPSGKWILVRGVAQSADEAVDSVLDVLDTLRGIWSLAHPTAVWFGLGIGPPRPMNPILLGPLHSLHRADGQRIPGRYWYDTNFPWWGAIPWTLGNWSEAGTFESYMRDAFDRPDVGPWIRSLVLRYCRALDIADPEMAFVQLWGLLEMLTGMQQGRSHERTVVRASSFYANSDRLNYLAVDLLREQRNHSVHGGVTSLLRRRGLDILHEYVRDILSFVIRFHSEFESPPEFFSFLDMPRDRRKLSREIELRSTALKWISHSEPDAGGETPPS